MLLSLKVRKGYLLGGTVGIDTFRNGNARRGSSEHDLVDTAKRLAISQSLAKVEQVEENRKPENMLQFSNLALFAGVAELADAQDLGSCGRKVVEVQVLSPAPISLSTSGPNLGQRLRRRSSGHSGRAYSKITVLFSYNRIRFSICQRTALESTIFSRSRPFSTSSSSASRCEIRVTPCSMIGPSSSTSVT